MYCRRLHYYYYYYYYYYIITATTTSLENNKKDIRLRYRLCLKVTYLALLEKGKYHVAYHSASRRRIPILWFILSDARHLLTSCLRNIRSKICIIARSKFIGMTRDVRIEMFTTRVHSRASGVLNY